MKRYLALLAALLLSLLLLASCGEAEIPPAADVTTAAPETEAPPVDIEIIRDGTAYYTIVRPDKTNQATLEAAILLHGQLEKLTGVFPGLTTDWIKPGTEYDSSTLEILIGHTGYPESAQALEGLGYGEYVVKQVGNKLVINAWDTHSLSHAVTIFLNELVEIDEGKCILPGGTDFVRTENFITDKLPLYPDEDMPLLYPTGSDNYLLRIDTTTLNAYTEYCRILESAGFTLYTENSAASNEFDTYINDDYVINAGFYDYYKEARIIIEPRITLPTLKPDATVEAVPPSFTTIGLEHYYKDPDKPLQNGQSFIWQLPDGSFLIVDGGVNRNYDSKTLYNFMQEHAPDKNNITVAAWIITHAHEDHHGAFYNFCNSGYANRINIEQVIANFPSDQSYVDSGYDITGTRDKLLNMAAKNSKNGVIKAHVGHVYYLGGAVVEMLYTYESHLPGDIEAFNTSSLVFTVDIAGQRFLVTGDATNQACTITANMYGDYLKSDFVQIAHHGAGVGSNTSVGVRDLYTHAAAPIILWPSGQRAYDAYYKEARNAHALNLPTTKEIFISGSRVTTLLLPYTVGTSGQESILK